MSMSDDVNKDYDDLLFDVRRSVRYHSRRVGFFDSFHRIVGFFALMLGSATVIAFGSEIAADCPTWAKLLPAVLVSALVAADLVVGSTQKARQHDHLVHNFVDLERGLEAGRDKQTKKLIAQITDRRLEIEATEPPVLHVLNTLCHNELRRAMGHEQNEQTKIGFLQRRFAPFFDFREHTLHLNDN